MNLRKSKTTYPVLHNRAGKTCCTLERQPAISQDSGSGLGCSLALDLLKNDNILTCLFLLRHTKPPPPSLTCLLVQCTLSSTLERMNRYQSRRIMLLREVAEIDKMFLTQKGNENEEISRSLEADQIHTKVRHNQPLKSITPVYILSSCEGTRLPSKLRLQPWPTSPWHGLSLALIS